MTPPPAELTLRGVVLGAAITVVFMAANVYMGLKTGMTFSSSIPAAVISMALLRLVGGAGILENNIVQTQASAAGTLCNVILVLPGLVLIGHWQGFPFWPSFFVCLLGGLLGVAYSIPLRRAMVSGSDLPFPEGKAAAEVLRAGHADELGVPGGGASGLRDLAGAGLVAGLLALATSGFRVLAEGATFAGYAGHAAFRFGSGFSLALIGVGYLVGIGACLALVLGVGIAWGIAVPVLTALDPQPGLSADAAAQAVWSGKVRLIGAGIIAVGGVWTVVSLMRPIAHSVAQALASARRTGEAVPLEERDLPIALVGIAAALLALPLAGLFAWFAQGADLTSSVVTGLVAAATLFVVVFGFLMAAACGYMAGLLGSSTSPISGIGILCTLVVALLLGLVLHEAEERFVIGLALFVGAVIVTIASIANDNLQDLKTGQLVGATPWRQQVALILGVVAGSVVIAPLLGLLYGAYGFVGALPRAGMNPDNAMAVPQAALMTQIASGIVRHELPWSMVLTGMGLGAVLVALEALLRRRGLSLPALTVGIGMYLPLSVEMTIALGGLIGWLAERAVRRRAGPEAIEATRRRGVLLASGFLVGESFLGVGLAAVDASTGRGDTLALVGPDFSTRAAWLGLGAFVIAAAGFHRLVSRPAAREVSDRVDRPATAFPGPAERSGA